MSGSLNQLLVPPSTFDDYQQQQLNALAPGYSGSQLSSLNPALSRVEPGPRANYMGEADAAMQLTPQEKYLYNTHLQNLYGTGKIVHPNGAISSLLQMSFEGPGGKVYNIPTVWGGRQLNPDDAIAAADRVGLDKFPSYASEDEAEARYSQLHDYLEKDTADFIRRSGL
jgi:hypothetical protein